MHRGNKKPTVASTNRVLDLRIRKDSTPAATLTPTQWESEINKLAAFFDQTPAETEAELAADTTVDLASLGRGGFRLKSANQVEPSNVAVLSRPTKPE